MATDATEEGETFAQRTAAFVEWFKKRPGTLLSDKVELVDMRRMGAGRGVVAVQDIAEDELICQTPLSAVLAHSSSDIPPHALIGTVDSGEWLPLIVTIIYEYLLDTDSEWYPYFQVLPTHFDTLMHWTDTELEYLQASAVVGKIGKAEAEAQWETMIDTMLVNEDLFPTDGADLETRTAELVKLCHMAGSLIQAYAFDIVDEQGSDTESGDSEEFKEDDEDDPVKALVPFADMFNADADRNNARLYQENGCLQMRATQAIKAGQQIFNDYGPLPRSDLLRMYGYTTENYAKYDVVEFSHDLLVEVAGMKNPKNNATWLKREEQLDEIGILDDGYAFPRPTDGAKLEDAVPGDIHMMLRALTANPNVSKVPKSKDESLSIEEAVLLSAVATKRLAEYKTSLEEDAETWKQLEADPETHLPPGPSAKRYLSALRIRCGEKEVLRDLIKLCQDHIATKTTDIANTDRKRKHSNAATTASKAKRTHS
ncbi:uncharacterized protein HMPREF1541_09374 [Cyphellophora europaea CBS 101466]|uniref:SET domain-containing protein n=1 Tax=Cyphellophora europaea (strain CBS 101466) TaxID=1220924 RepID=W2SA25_CYPE1|nr:uncharacterized protein HMPREF1541_09374 [Cyphellophora europaea CBS 101466]ETN45542.1 hypothetical protein HMPREF1541_09374 [Cyphellophora europaea CBS 101466]